MKYLSGRAGRSAEASSLMRGCVNMEQNPGLVAWTWNRQPLEGARNFHKNRWGKLHRLIRIWYGTTARMSDFRHIIPHAKIMNSFWGERRGGVLYRSLWVPGISCRQRGVPFH